LAKNRGNSTYFYILSSVLTSGEKEWMFLQEAVAAAAAAASAVHQAGG
jgi:hypothetical protein